MGTSEASLDAGIRIQKFKIINIIKYDKVLAYCKLLAISENLHNG